MLQGMSPLRGTSGLAQYLAHQDRRNTTYRPGEECIGIVQAIITENGGDLPTTFRVNAAWIALGAGERTCGQVADWLTEDSVPIARARGLTGKLFP